MRFDPDLLERLQPGFAKAFDAMEALDRGSIANPDEQRMLGHYWLRQPDLVANRRGVSISGDPARPASLMVFLKQLVPVT
jgi:glucose-6-phosphate isomerase